MLRGREKHITICKYINVKHYGGSAVGRGIYINNQNGENANDFTTTTMVSVDNLSTICTVA